MISYVSYQPPEERHVGQDDSEEAAELRLCVSGLLYHPRMSVENLRILYKGARSLVEARTDDERATESARLLSIARPKEGA